MRLFSKLADIWRHEELRNKIWVTLGLILVYRIGSFIVIPGVNGDVLAEQMNALGSGGGFASHKEPWKTMKWLYKRDACTFQQTRRRARSRPFDSV